MANVSRPFGARPARHLNGSRYTGITNLYEIAVGNGTATAVGDFVKASTDAATDVYATVERFGTSGEVTSGLITGVIVGFVVDPTALNTPQHRLASTKRFALVADSPDIIFEIMDGATVATPLASIGLNCGVQCTAITAATGNSNMTTGATAATTTNSLPLKVLQIKNAPDNDTAAANQMLLVVINQHALMGGQTAV